MLLKFERCTIRDYRSNDAESLAKHANNRKVWLGLRDAFPHPYTIEDAKNFYRVRSPVCRGYTFASRSTVPRLAELVCGPAKTCIDIPRSLVTGSLKNSGAMAL